MCFSLSLPVWDFLEENQMQCEVWWIGNDVISLEENVGDSGGTFEPIVSDLTPTFVYFSLMLALSILYSMLVGIVLPFVLHFQ